MGAAAAAVDAAAAVIDMGGFTNRRLLLQFHITGRCNLRCRHCYRAEGDVQPLSYDDIVMIIEQYKQLLASYNSAHRTGRGHINITGGEPFIREDIADILEYLGANSQYFSYGILSNGSFIDEEMIRLLRRTSVSFVQLSIDGDRDTHDQLRAAGDYDRVFGAARLLSENSIRTYISFTANSKNYVHLPKVASQCRRAGVTKLWSDRLVPIGTGSEMQELSIGSAELEDYVRTLKKARGGMLSRMLYPGTQVALDRALQFIGSDGDMYTCSAGNSLITVDEFGRVMPCRRMPIYCGDVFSSTLMDIYRSHEVFVSLRNSYIPRECAACAYGYLCRGGAKCQSYAAYGTFLRADPACPLADRSM